MGPPDPRANPTHGPTRPTGPTKYRPIKTIKNLRKPWENFKNMKTITTFGASPHLGHLHIWCITTFGASPHHKKNNKKHKSKKSKREGLSVKRNFNKWGGGWCCIIFAWFAILVLRRQKVKVGWDPIVDALSMLCKKPVSSTKTVGASTSQDPANGPTFGPAEIHWYKTSLLLWVIQLRGRGGQGQRGPVQGP